MDHITNVKASYKLLCDHIDSFVEYLLDKGELVSARVYQYPVFTDRDIGHSPDSIPLTPVDGQQALLLALDYLQQHAIKEEQSGRIVPRMPGTIVFQHPDPIGCIMRLDYINVLKNNLNEAITNISPKKDVRFETVKLALPNLIKKVATRHVIYANKPVKSVSFSWVNRHNGKNLSKKQVLAILKTSEEYENKNSIADPDFADYVAKEIVKISHMPDSSQFVIRRPLRITPMLNFNYQRDGLPHLKQRPSSRRSGALAPKNYVAHSPAFIFNDLPKVFPFWSYEANEQGTEQNLDDKQTVREQLILPRLHLYLKNS